MNNAITHGDKEALTNFIWSTDMYTNGAQVQAFEKAWSEWLGARYSLFVSSGSTANFLLLAAVKELYAVPRGAKVLVPACTWVTNVSPVIQLGLEPVFCDINLEDFSFDLEKLPSPEGIRIVFVTHLLGLGAPIEKLRETYPDALFIEDICESHGVEDNTGVRRGASSSLGSTFSFYYGHHMTTIEGGMISTNDTELFELMRLKRSHGMARNCSPERYALEAARYPHIDPRFLFLTDGYNFRNTELAAVLGLCQLERLDESIRIRRRNFQRFFESVDPAKVYIPNLSKTNSSFCLPIICKRDGDMPRLKKVLELAGIETRPIVAGNLLRHPFLKEWSGVDVPNAEILNSNGVYVGNSQFVTDEMVDLLVALLLDHL